MTYPESSLLDYQSMSGFWQRLFNLQQAVENSSPSVPAIHELIQRSEEDQAAYQEWRDSYVLKQLRQWIRDEYHHYLQKGKSRASGNVDFLKIPSSQGFIAHFRQTNYSRQEATFFFDFLKERVKTLNYRTQISDTRTYSRSSWIETVERHYLKPRLEIIEGKKMDQQFGNITIELEIRDEVVHHLRLRATHYQDFNFLPVQDFKDLMTVLLED